MTCICNKFVPTKTDIQERHFPKNRANYNKRFTKGNLTILDKKIYTRLKGNKWYNLLALKGKIMLQKHALPAQFKKSHYVTYGYHTP